MNMCLSSRVRRRGLLRVPAHDGFIYRKKANGTIHNKMSAILHTHQINTCDLIVGQIKLSFAEIKKLY